MAADPMTMAVLWQSRWLSVIRTSSGEEVIRTSDAVLVIATDEAGQLLLLEEPAPAFEARSLFLPGGAVEAGEDVLAAAQRELRGETGFAADNLTRIGCFRSWSK